MRIIPNPRRAGDPAGPRAPTRSEKHMDGNDLPNAGKCPVLHGTLTESGNR